MNWLNKHHPVNRYPSGLEWRIFRRLHLIGVGGVGLLLAIGIANRIISYALNIDRYEHWVGKVDFVLCGIFFTFISLMVALIVGCALVIIMKGPHYTADSYVLPDADKPKT